jgi:hypothetical protein
MNEIAPKRDTAGLTVMSVAECLAALSPPGIGAVTVTRGALPVALPIGYCVQDGSLFLRTSSTSTLGRLVSEVVAFCAFSVDGRQAGGPFLVAGSSRPVVPMSGWSVSLTGLATRVKPNTSADLYAVPLPVWGDLDNDVLIKVSTDFISGRRLMS